MDRIDHKILAILNEDGRISNVDLARRAGLSPTPCQLRVKRLIEKKYILGFKAVLNAEKLERSHIAFVEVKLNQTNQKTLNAFNDAVRKIPQIEQCHLIAGSFDYLLKVRTADINEYRKFLGEILSTFPEVLSTSTNVSMEAVKEDLMSAKTSASI